MQGLGRGVSQAFGMGHRFGEAASNQTLNCTHTSGALCKPMAHSASLTLYTINGSFIR